MTRSINPPASLLEVFCALAPRVRDIFDDTELTPVELFILYHIKYFGSKLRGRQVFLGKHLIDILRTDFHYSPPQASKTIKRLVNRKLIDWMHITDDEKEYLTGDRKGKKFVLVLLPGGHRKIRVFSQHLDRLYGATASRIDAKTLPDFSRLFDSALRDVALYVANGKERHNKGAINYLIS